MRFIWQQTDWPDFRWEADALIGSLGKARLAQGKHLSRVQSLGITLKPEARLQILTEESVKTAAIEGEILDRDSVRSSAARRLGIPYAGLPEPGRHVDGLVEVLLDATSKYGSPLTLERLKAWQAALFPTGYSGLRKIHTGKWRGPEPMQVVSGAMGRETVHFEAPPSQRLQSETERFLMWWDTGKPVIEGLLRAGIAHIYFLTLHPFEDGNGRVARALTEMALAQDEASAMRFYSLSNRIMAERDAYYSILEKTQKGDLDITGWLEWFLECLTRSIDDAGTLLAGIMSKAAFWKKHGHVALSTHQRKVLNRLLDVGPGGFEGGLTTRKYVAMTRVSRATAYREITDLVKKELLVPNDAKGRNISYRLMIDNSLEF
ncbi:MAG: Fic family protein [bacterium]|nr:Fic family protein [bacterium]